MRRFFYWNFEEVGTMSSVVAELEESVGYSPIQRMRHSAAHVMAEAVLEIFPDARLGIGPAIEDGFYYDFELPRPLQPEDLEAIEQRMREIVAAKLPFERRELDAEEAKALFRERNQPYKVELIEDLTSGARHGARDEMVESPD